MGWGKIVEEVRNFKSNNSPVWFRGQNNKNYKLHSSLYRNNQNHPSLEITLYNYYKNIGHLYHMESGWNLVFIMQHHGLPTRLLDWTESFAVALFFAIKDWDRQQDACIWLLNPLLLNNLSIKNSFFHRLDYDNYEYRLHEENDMRLYDHSIAIFPKKNNNRIIAQHGVFTVQGRSGIPLEEEFNRKLVATGALKRIDIAPNLINEVEEYLVLSGINTFTLFPDLDGLAKHLKEILRLR